MIPILAFLAAYLLGSMAPAGFDMDSDLLLAHYDCRTDVDDLHSVAAFATILADPDFSDLRYHAVAGAYGMQEGLYVPPNELFEAAFGDNWSDAHTDRRRALGRVAELVLGTLAAGGDVWVAEGGQSDFTADLVRLVRSQHPEMDTRGRIHVVQHAAWNEESTTPEKLRFVRATTDYRRIPDGNATGNGTPGYRSEEPIDWPGLVTDKHVADVWATAVSIGRRFNGIEGRYLNEAVANGGLDFSDTVEIVWILDVQGVDDARAFFEVFGGA